MSVSDHFDFSVLPGMQAEKCPAKFEWGTEFHKFNKNGEEVNEEVKTLFIRIKHTDGFGEIFRVPTESDMYAYQDEYNAFLNGQSYKGAKGTELESWKELDIPQVKKLHSLEIYTIEAFANASELIVKRFGLGGLELQVKAKAYLKLKEKEDAVKKDEAVSEMLVSAESEIAELKRQVAELAAKKAK